METMMTLRSFVSIIKPGQNAGKSACLAQVRHNPSGLSLASHAKRPEVTATQTALSPSCWKPR
jgi:hypothetical protein